MPAKPLTATAAKSMAKSFAQDQAKGGLLDVVFIALVEKAITKFIEWLLQKYDIIPKSE